jgi:hypothetical protein
LICSGPSITAFMKVVATSLNSRVAKVQSAVIDISKSVREYFSSISYYPGILTLARTAI